MVGWRVGVVGVGFWARVWVLNEETFELEREEQKKQATCKSTFFPAIFSFFQARGSGKFHQGVPDKHFKC